MTALLVQGAKILLDRTRERAGTTAWETMNIFSKREMACESCSPRIYPANRP